MKQRERQKDERERPRASGGSGGDDLAAIGAAAERLYAAAEEAIDRVLSKDSDSFLAANRQQGGQ